MVLLFTDNCRPTENLILKAERKHYRTSIAPWHWQLRSLISAEANNTLYFPAGINNNHITRLNTETREFETIKHLSFPPRCLVAQGGWICCGGENGEFAIIKDSDQHGSGSGSGENSTRTNVDDALNSHVQSQLRSLESPAGNDPSLSSSFSRDMFNLLEQRLNGPAKTWTSSNHKYGTERVNCITLWEPPQATSLFPGRTGHYATPVAVLSNNDKKVTIVGLHDSEFLDEIELPDCVNRSLLSPDGCLLASICDDPFLYIHLHTPVNQGKLGESYEWKSLPRVRLESPAKNARDDCRGSFAASFSSSGRFLAVGVQNGTVKVFNVAALHTSDVNPLVASFATSRHPEGNGAVRAMAFCPGPYDLLAWTEHRGRVGVADARSNFSQRQTISLDQQDEYEHLSLTDRSTSDARLSINERTSVSGASSQIARILSQASSPQPPAHASVNSLSAEVGDRINQPFRADETAVLEAVSHERRRREAQEAREQIAQEIARGNTTWRSSMWAERVSSTDSSASEPSEDNVSVEDFLAFTESHQRVNPTSPSHLLTFHRVLSAIMSGQRSYATDPLLTIRRQRETLNRILDRERRDTREVNRTSGSQNPTNPEQERERRAPTPRRRSSVMQTLALNPGSDRVGGVAPSTLSRVQSSANTETRESRDSPTPWSSGRLTSGWADLEALYDITSGDGAGSNDTTRLQRNRTRRAIPVINDVWNDDLSGFGTRRSYSRLNSREHAQNPDDTAGLTWSEDGQTLWVGAEDGIYEFKINLQGRKIFPEITLR